MEAVAQAPDFARIRGGGEPGEVRQRRDRIIRWQHLPGAGEEARLFQMQVGDEERRARRPEQRAFGQRDQLMAGERKGNHHAAMPQAGGAINLDGQPP